MRGQHHISAWPIEPKERTPIPIEMEAVWGPRASPDVLERRNTYFLTLTGFKPHRTRGVSSIPTALTRLFFSRLNPWSIFLLENIIISRTVKKFVVFFGKQLFSLRFYKSPQLGPVLSQTNPVQISTHFHEDSF